MVDRTQIALLLALNVVAVGVLWPHFAQTEIGSRVTQQALLLQEKLQAAMSSQPSTTACGLTPRAEYILTSTRVVLPSGVQPASVHIRQGRIIKVTPGVAAPGPLVLDVHNSVVSPGIIDVHVHLNEPGREDWEGISTGTAAAAAGGITTVIDMPLNSFPTTTIPSRLQEKQELANVKALVRIGHWAGLTPDNAADHHVLWALVEGGAMGFKSFMSPSGIDDFPNVGGDDIAAALPFLKSAGVPYYVHAELISHVPQDEGDSREYARYMATRPPSFEQAAIQLLIRLLDADATPAAPGFRVHIAHLADAGSLPLLKAAQERGHPISVETCPHYLLFSSEQIANGNTLFKCAPPIRGEDNRKALLAAVLDGSINLVASDHSPAPPELKQLETGDFTKAWGGISGVQYLLPATWTAIKSAGGDLQLLTRILSAEPAKLIEAADRKGKIQEGYDADFVVWNPDVKADTSRMSNKHQHKSSPFTDKELQGKVIATIVEGHMMYREGASMQHPCGTPVIVRRNTNIQA